MSVAPATEPVVIQTASPEVNLKDYLEIIRRRRSVFIQIFFMVLGVGIVVTLMGKPVYTTTARIIVPTDAAKISVIDAKSPLGILTAGHAPDNLATQLQIIQSSPFQIEARKRANLSPRPGVIPPSPKVAALEGTNIILVNVEGGDPEEIARLANAIVELHMEKTDQQSTDSILKTLEHVKRERERALKQMNEIEQRLISFRKAHRIVELKADEEAQAREYIELQSKVTETQNNIVMLEARLADLRQRLAKEDLEITEETRTDNPRIAKLRERLDDLEMRRTDLLKQYQPTSRLVTEVDASIAAVNAALAKEAEFSVSRKSAPNPVRITLQQSIASLETELQGIRAAYNAANARFQSRRGVVTDLGQWEIQLTRMERDRELYSRAYTELSEQFRDLEIRKNVNTRTARVLDQARVPTTPIRPNKPAQLMITLALALCLASAMAFVQEFLDDRINSPDDVERISGLPALGHVPLISEDQPRQLSALPANSHVAEAYRALRSAIGFAGIDSTMRRIQLTSAGKGEGKSTTAANLATAMAMDGKRVILVDADLRRPGVGRMLNMPNSPGLSEVLVGMRRLEDALQPTDLDNLKVLCAGPIPPNPAELLGSTAFDRVMEQLDELADVVIYDTPPCIPVTDPLIIASRMDGVILVLHAGQTRKGAVRHVIQMLQRARARVVGTVFNRVQQNKGGYYYYHYYYYYGDGYYSDGGRDGRRRGGKRKKPALASRNGTSPMVPSGDNDRNGTSV